VSTRLRHIKSGAVVSVSAKTAAQLGGEWEPVEKPAKKAPAKKAAAKSDKK
jgi:hypothetical protein